MKKLFLGTYVLALCFLSTSVATAATDWDSLSEADFIEATYKDGDTTENAKVHALNVGYVYKKFNDKKPVSYAGSVVAGTLYTSPDPNLHIVGSTTITYESGKSKPKESYSMSVISDGHSIYFKPNGLKNKQLRNKWIKGNSEQYETIGIGLGVPQLFDVFDTSTEREIKAKTAKIVAAIRKTDLWSYYYDDITDDRTVNNATRYNFELNSDSIQPFYTELTKTLTLDEIGFDGLLGKNFVKKLDGDVTTFMAEQSFMSIWIDDTSNRPVRILEVLWIPITEKRKTVYVLQISDTEIGDYDTQPKLQVPNNSIDAVIAAKQLKIKL